MKTKEGFVLRPLLNEYIITGEGLAQVNFNKMISLNSTAAWLWQEVEGKDFSVEDLKNLLLQRYEVTEEVAGADAARLAETWIQAGIVDA